MLDVATLKEMLGKNFRSLVQGMRGLPAIGPRAAPNAVDPAVKTRGHNQKRACLSIGFQC